MKLIKIKIIHFGQLSDLTFTLPSDRLNVFFGKNEAGKSTVVAFIKQILFGFHLNNHAARFFENYKPLAQVSPMGGSLVFVGEKGNQFELERLWAKGDKTKLGKLTVKSNDQLVPASVFFDQIQNIDGDFYADSFIFNQEMLGQVTNLSQADLLERIYYLGAANSNRLLNLRDQFAKKADTLFKKTGKKPEVNQLLLEIAEQRQEVSSTKSEFGDYQALNLDLQKLQGQLEQTDAQLKQLRSRQERLQALKREQTNYLKLQELKANLRDIKFNVRNYQKAQELAVQEKNLQKNIASLEKRLSQLGQTGEVSKIGAELLQTRPQVLQWQSEYQSCLQKKEQIQAEEEQILALNSDARAVVPLSQEQIVQLENDYQALPKAPKEEAEPLSKSKSYLSMIGIALLVVGLLAGFALKMSLVSVFGVILGVGMIAWDKVKEKEAQKQGENVQKQRDQAKQAQTHFAEQYGLDPTTLNLTNLINDWRQYQAKELVAASNLQQKKQIDEHVDQLADKIADFLHKKIKHDFAALLDALTFLENNLKKQQHQEDQKQNLQSSLNDEQKNLHELDLQLRAVVAQDQVKDMTEYQQRHQEYLSQTKLQTQISALEENLHDDLPQLAKMQKETALLEKDEHELSRQFAAAEETRSQYQKTIAEIQVKMRQLANSTAVFAAKQELANTETKFGNASAEYLANLLAAKWIGRALDLASNERFPKMLAAAKEYFGLLTAGRYNDIQLDKKITVTRSDGKKRKVEYLSRGTAEQLYFALKLAFIGQIKDQINLPILIDDSFVNFDDQRTDLIKQLLDKVAANNQILIFTAQTALVERLAVTPLTFTKGKQNV
ncbi:AAA family ATPase [Lactobacillus sp. ESL0791]|uniref:AAA family ATPase n=1 Tax=Lactobacillus sp. ESL0791 TaxID=2983234 RepID=UPI0023F9CE8F|nr:AAA family ATPase [Lactobacillus sp. ESL0791]MDF7638504.1 AAA family ATPase [Lactobacillus sp. ESL0791]